MTIRTQLHDIPSILEYVEGVDPQQRGKLLVAYFEQVHSLKDFLTWYFEEVKGKFNPRDLENVEYDLPEAGVPAYSSIQRNMSRIRTIVSDSESIETRRRLKKMVFNSISMVEILILENVFGGTLEEMYPSIDWQEVRTLLGVSDAAV